MAVCAAAPPAARHRLTEAVQTSDFIVHLRCSASAVARGPAKSPRWVSGAGLLRSVECLDAYQPGRLPISRRVVVLVDTAAVVRGPQEVLVHVVARGVLEHLLVEVDDVATLAFVVLQGRPRQRVIFLADAEETAERHDRVN